MTACRPDANQAEIVAALRAYGAHVQDTSQMRPSIGFDLIAARHGQLYLCEVKVDAKARLTAKEKRTHDLYRSAGVTIHRLETVEDVEAMLR